MMHKARVVFKAWMDRLEREPELFGLRLFAPDGGLIWRNAAAREFYERYGFFGSPTTPWSGVKKWLTAAELDRLEQIYQQCFETGHAVDMMQTAQVPGFPLTKTQTRFMAVYGTMRCGVLITHLQPCDVWERALPILPRDRGAESA